jgi:hypothetical protein
LLTDPDDADVDGLGVADEDAHRQCRGQCRGHDRRQGADGVGADDELESIERAGQRCVERRRDGAGGAAAHEGAQIGPAHLEREPEARRDPGADLRVPRLEADRGAEAVRDQVLECDEEAVSERHAAAVQGVRLDGIDRRAFAQPGADVQHDAEERAAERGHGKDGDPPQARRPAEALLTRQAEQKLVHHLRDNPDRRHEHAREAADRKGDEDKPDLARAHQRPQPLRRLHERAFRDQPAMHFARGQEHEGGTP